MRLQASIDDNQAFGRGRAAPYRAYVPQAQPKFELVRHFGLARIRAWEAEATRLNARGEGDQATFVPRRKD